MSLDLIGLDCDADQRLHYIDDRHHAEVLATDGDHLFRAICGHLVVCAPLATAPRPLCSRCRDLAGARRAAAAVVRSRYRIRRGRRSEELHAPRPDEPTSGLVLARRHAARSAACQRAHGANRRHTEPIDTAPSGQTPNPAPGIAPR